MKRLFFTLSTLFCATVSFAQTATKTHTVAKGETITQIAKKYNTTNNVLFLLNPEAVDGVSENQIIKIPTTSSVQHQVQAKETVYGISKQYNIAIEKLYDLNPGLKENGLKIDQFLNLAETTSKNTASVSNNNQPVKNLASTTVIVEKGETIYGIAVKNNTTVSVLYELNQGLLENGLKVGQPINIPVSGEVKKEIADISKKTKAKTIIVQPKQTIYNIAKTNNISQEQLMEWNPDLKNGLKDGSTLIVGYSYEKVPFNDNSAPKPIENTSAPVKKGIDLSLPNDGSTRDLVLLLPFNVTNNNFNNPSINQSIKEDVFLNMT
ncbi:MAG: LysM peptidoglycan-binding domain-containing protein, partial [Myroides sp.]